MLVDLIVKVGSKSALQVLQTTLAGQAQICFSLNLKNTGNHVYQFLLILAQNFYPFSSLGRLRTQESILIASRTRV